MNTIHLRKDDTVKAILAASFPDYKGTRIRAILTDSIVLSGTNWDEGSKTDYVFVRLNGMQAVPIPDAPYMHASPVHETPIPIPPGVVAVAHHRIGLWDYIAIHANGSDVQPLLDKPQESITEDEKTVLIATRSLKSSYAGVKNYRFQEANERRGITLSRWEAAKATLIEKKLLAKNGAITPEGKNLIGSENL